MGPPRVPTGSSSEQTQVRSEMHTHAEMFQSPCVTDCQQFDHKAFLNAPLPAMNAAEDCPICLCTARDSHLSSSVV